MFGLGGSMFDVGKAKLIYAHFCASATKLVEP